MNQYQLDRPRLYEAFMAGQYKADREQAMLKARIARTAQERCHYAKWARELHRRYMDYLSQALQVRS